MKNFIIQLKGSLKIAFILICLSTVIQINSQCNKYSLNFNGTSSYVSIPDNTTLRPDYVSVSLNFKTTSTALQALLNKWKIADGSSLNYGISINHTAFNPIATYAATTDHGTNCAVGMGYSICKYINGYVSVNTWINIVFTYNGSQQKIYVNGNLVQTSTTSLGPIGKCTGGELALGMAFASGPLYFSGKMDEITIYNRALSQTEIQQRISTILNPANETGLVAYYRFEEGTGTQVNDLSGNNNNGTLYNCTWSSDVPFASGIVARLNLSGAQRVCPNDSFLLQVPFSSNFKYAWYKSGTTINNAMNNIYYAKSAGNYYCLISDNAGGCQKYSDTVYLTVTQPLLPTIRGPFILSNGIFNATYTTPVISGLTYNWTLTNGKIQSGQGTSNVGVLWNTSGPYSLTLTIDSNGCKNSKTVIIYPSSYSVSQCNYHSLSFNGTSSYVSIPDHTSMRPDNVTISIYFKTTSTAMQAMLNKWKISDASNLNYGITINHTFFNPVASYAATTDHGTNCAVGAGFSICTHTDGYIPLNVWINVIFTYDGSVQKMYLNGILVESITTNKGPIGKCTGGELALGIGYLADPNYFSGKMDEISIYNRSLSQTEIQQRINTVLSPADETGLIAYYRFEEGAGTQADDMSGNNNNGTIYNCTWSSDVPFTSGISGHLNLKGAQSICMNDSLLLTAPLKTNFKYSWFNNGTSMTNASSNNIYIKSLGNYFCSISDTVGGCQKNTDTVLLSVNSLPVVPTITGPLNLSGGVLSAIYAATNSRINPCMDSQQWKYPIRTRNQRHFRRMGKLRSLFSESFSHR